MDEPLFRVDSSATLALVKGDLLLVEAHQAKADPKLINQSRGQAKSCRIGGPPQSGDEGRGKDPLRKYLDDRTTGRRALHCIGLTALYGSQQLATREVNVPASIHIQSCFSLCTLACPSSVLQPNQSTPVQDRYSVTSFCPSMVQGQRAQRSRGSRVN